LSERAWHSRFLGIGVAWARANREMNGLAGC